MEKKPMFYGGKVGPWIPVLLMLAGMLASTIIGGPVPAQIIHKKKIFSHITHLLFI